jgi:uncharacterized protein YggU (UPF0235/DUF167 family)
MKARLTLKVRAGARQTQFAGRYADAWRLHVAAPPVDGKANDAIIRFLAELTGIPRSAVRIVTGATASTKILELDGISPDLLHRAILESNGPPSDSRSAPPPEP